MITTLVFKALGVWMRLRANPWGKLAIRVALATVVVLVIGLYLRHKIIEHYEASMGSKLRERVHDAIRAGDDAVRNPERLRETDGHRRD